MTPSRKSPRFESIDIAKKTKRQEQTTDTKKSKETKSGNKEQITDDSSSTDEEENSDNDVEDITPGPGPTKIFDIPMEAKKDMQGNLKMADYWAKAAKCEKLRSKKKEFLQKSDFFMKHYMDLKAQKEVKVTADIPELISKPNTRSMKRKSDSSPVKDVNEEAKKNKPMSTSEAKRVLEAAKKSMGIDKVAKRKRLSSEQISDEENQNIVPPSPQKKPKKPKTFLTKDPKSKHDKELMKAKQYELCSQDKKKNQDGDCSKDETWEPNTSEELEIKSTETVKDQKEKSIYTSKPSAPKPPVKSSGSKKPKKGSGKKKKEQNSDDSAELEFICPTCSEQFSDNDVYSKHIKKCSKKLPKIVCPIKD